MGCVRPGLGPGTGALVTGSGSVNCRCGQITSPRKANRIMKRKNKRKITRKTGLKDLINLKTTSLARVDPLTRIIGGVTAVPGTVPWQVSLAVSGDLNIIEIRTIAKIIYTGSNIFCGGSLVTDRHLVTAAHCLSGVETELYDIVDIILMEYNTLDQNRGIRRKIWNVVLHPSFNENTLQNDIAVITMKMPVNIAAGKSLLS